MLTVLLVVQVIVAVAMILVILLQRSASDGLGGLGGGGGNSLMSGRASANALTKTTAILATVFMINSLVMASITSRAASEADDLIEAIAAEKQIIEDAEPSVPTEE